MEIERSLINVDDASVLIYETCEVHCVALSLLVEVMLLLSALQIDLLWDSVLNTATLVIPAKRTSISLNTNLLLDHLNAVSQRQVCPVLQPLSVVDVHHDVFRFT